MFSNPALFIASTLFLLPGIVVGIIVHEIGHAVVARLQGDTTAEARGYYRNGLREYFTLYGIAMALFWRVGWGAEAPVNEARLRGRWGRLAWMLGGPAANLLVALLFGIIVRLLASFYAFPDELQMAQTPMGYVSTLAMGLFFFNLGMFAFHLLPIPGFDGWRIAELFLRSRYPHFFYDVAARRMQITNALLLIAFVASFVPGINLLSVVMTPLYAPVSLAVLGACRGWFGLNPCIGFGP